ncbi:hypothetical protein J2X66_005857 [Pseudomonas sp. 3296]|nr:hypothetical protein [Pseudomonas sp. 3296]
MARANLNRNHASKRIKIIMKALKFAQTLTTQNACPPTQRQRLN